MGVSEWFCCLNPPERAALRTCVNAYVLTMGWFIPKDIFDVQWAFVTASKDARQVAFLSFFYMQEETVFPDEPSTPVDVYTFNNPSLWAEIVAYAIAPTGSCADGCKKRWFD